MGRSRKSQTWNFKSPIWLDHNLHVGKLRSMHTPPPPSLTKASWPIGPTPLGDNFLTKNAWCFNNTSMVAPPSFVRVYECFPKLGLSCGRAAFGRKSKQYVSLYIKDPSSSAGGVPDLRPPFLPSTSKLALFLAFCPWPSCSYCPWPVGTSFGGWRDIWDIWMKCMVGFKMYLGKLVLQNKLHNKCKIKIIPHVRRRWANSTHSNPQRTLEGFFTFVGVSTAAFPCCKGAKHDITPVTPKTPITLAKNNQRLSTYTLIKSNYPTCQHFKPIAPSFPPPATTCNIHTAFSNMLLHHIASV